MNVGHGRPRFQIVKLISYRSCPSTNCNCSKYLSLAPLDCRMSKYINKKAKDDFLDGSAALTFAVISCWNCQNNWRLYSNSRIATVATAAEMSILWQVRTLPIFWCFSESSANWSGGVLSTSHNCTFSRSQEYDFWVEEQIWKRCTSLLPLELLVVFVRPRPMNKRHPEISFPPWLISLHFIYVNSTRLNLEWTTRANRSCYLRALEFFWCARVCFQFAAIT